MLLVSPVNLNILLVIFGVALVLLNDQFSSGVTSIFDCSFISIKNAFSMVLQKSLLIMVRVIT